MYLGKNQVAVGIVSINFVNKSSESALSVYPVAIANCKEERCVLRIIGWLQKKAHNTNQVMYKSFAVRCYFSQINLEWSQILSQTFCDVFYQGFTVFLFF